LSAAADSGPNSDRHKGYRPGVGIVLMNRDGKVFVGRRIDRRAGLPAWQMPQGGIDRNEKPRHAALRELYEETGTDKAEIVAKTRGWLSYDLPPAVAATARHGRWRGQRQRWFLMRFLGEDIDIDLARHDAEFDAWKWVDPAELPGLIVDFKRPVYVALLDEFREHLTR
jgi:putative (di)nucleoside polyphosphate hydrolase